MKKISDGAQNFACYLIDKCEGETITEESILRWLGKMADEPQYNPSASIADTAGANRTTSNPGGCECSACGCIFIGGPEHDKCGRCVVADTAGAKPNERELFERWITTECNYDPVDMVTQPGGEVYVLAGAQEAWDAWMGSVEARAIAAPPAPSVADAAGASEQSAIQAFKVAFHESSQTGVEYDESIRVGLRAAAGASEGQEPVAWTNDVELDHVTKHGGKEGCYWPKYKVDCDIALYIHPSAEIAALRERIAGMEKDAERYRWLRGEGFDRPAHMWVTTLPAGTPIVHSDLDAAIDAAIAKELK